MSTLTIASPAYVAGGESYLGNVGRAARALLAALLAVRPQAEAEEAHPVVARRATAEEHLSLYRLYCLASPYDSVMPNLADELNVIARRAD